MSNPFNTASHRFKSFCHTNNDIPNINTRSDHIPDDLAAIMSRTNDSHPSDPDVKLQCCCGRPECVYLENNNTVLGGIERDLETAARLGQALLTRHESYVTDSQREHERLTVYINELEEDRTNLQTRNEQIVEENRELLSQLEAANTSLKESDSHVKSLEALLRDCEVEVRRLNILTRRTEELELKMLDMEKERMNLTRKIEDSNDETKSTIKRWKESELRVRQLEIEVQKIEWEAKQDKERHEEIIARLERERILERELGGAEGRLKGAAAVQGLKGSVTGSNVVSHFVRDILQDNANLQAGIAELRELLQTSNEEVQNLREQIMEHQPVESDPSQNNGTTSQPLSEELGWSPTKQVQQEVHVHHHYHAKIAGKKERLPTVRRASRKRAVIGLGVLPSTPESSAPTTPVAGPHRFVSSPVLPITLHQPHARRNRWSVQSAATGTSQISSFPSSPRSYYDRSSTIFDRLEPGEESSRPTSPESAAGFSDSMFRRIKYDKVHGEDLEDNENFAVLLDEQGEGSKSTAIEATAETSVGMVNEDSEQTETWSRDLTPKPSQILAVDERRADPVEPEPPDPPSLEEPANGSTRAQNLESGLSDEADLQSDVPIISESLPNAEPQDSADTYDFNDVLDIANQQPLRRRGSHDSLVSISGMDIHIAKRPTTGNSQSSSLLKGNRAYFARSPSATRTFASAQPLTTVTEFTALSSTRTFSANNSLTTHLLPIGQRTPDKNTSMSIEALSGIAGLSSPSQAETQSTTGGLGRLVGGWVRGKWGIAPVKSSGDLRTQAQSRPPAPIEPLPLFGGRAPGINQPGVIPGFRPTRNQPTTEVQVKMMDEQGLKDILAE